MRLPVPREPDHPESAHQLSNAPEPLHRQLCRPIVFRQPDRVVHPNSWLEHIPFAFWLIDAVRPATLVELGTHSGNSYAAFAQAIRMLELPTAAYAVDTWEGDPQAGFYDESVFTEWAAYHAHHFSSFSRLIRSTFAEALQHFADGTVDVLHIDGCHTYESVSADFALWRPKISETGVVLFHDTNVRERDFGAWRLWRELRDTCPSFEFLHGHGLGVLGVGPNPPEPLRWLLTTAAGDGATTAAVREFFSTLGAAVGERLEKRAAAEALIAATQRADAAEAATAGAIAEAADRARTAEAVAAEREAELQQQAHLAAQLTREVEAAQHDLAVAQRLLRRRQHRIDRLEGRLKERDVEVSALEAERKRQDAAAVSQVRLIAELHQLHRRRGGGPGQGSELRSNASATPVEKLRQTGKGAVRLGLRGLRRTASTPAALGFIPTRRRGLHRPPLKLLFTPARLREADLIVRGGLFDEAYYIGRNPDVRASGMTALTHYVLQGSTEVRNPHPLFDAAYYLRRNPDVAVNGLDPLLHYQRSGAFEGRNPHPLFDVAFYLRSNPDINARRLEPLGHFLRFGAEERRDPNEFFDCAYYLRDNPDVAASGTNPLVHFAADGWRERRRPSAAFDITYYLTAYPDVAAAGVNPLEHYLETGRLEGRRALPEDDVAEPPRYPSTADLPVLPLTVLSLERAADDPPTIVCLSHVMPYPPRAGNEYRIFRLLRWFRDRGYRIVPVIAPLPGERIDPEAVRRLAAEFTNAVLCGRDGRVDYVLGNVPDVLKSLTGEIARPVSILLGEPAVRDDHRGDLLRLDRTFCHDVLISAVTRLQQALGPHVLLAEYIWMTRILPLVPDNVVKVVDTHDVFSTKREKVLRFGVDDLNVEPTEEASRLGRADLVVAIQDDERRELQRIVPDIAVVTAGVDFDVIDDPGAATGQRILYVASANPLNKKGLADFLRLAWPGVRRAMPAAELILAGDIGGTLVADVPGVTRLGRVVDLSPLYRDARVVINPGVAGTGLKVKTLEALGHFRTVVSWPSGVEGLAPELAALCVVVQDWYTFAQELVALLSADPAPSFSADQCATIERFMAPEVAYRPMTDAIEALMRERSGILARPQETSGAQARG